MSNSNPTDTLFGHLMREHKADLAIRRHEEMRWMDLAILAALIAPDAARSPKEAFNKALAFANGMNNEWLDWKIKLLTAQRTIADAAKHYRESMPLQSARNFPGSNKIIPPAKFPVDSKSALKQILKAKKTHGARIKVVELALAQMNRSSDPVDESNREILGLIAKGASIKLTSDLDFWTLAKCLQPFCDQRKLRKKKK